MGKWHPFENIRTNLMNNPPLVVFFLCMVLMAAAFIGFGAYTNKHDVRDPDVTQDWNQILSSLAALKLCALDTDTEGKAASADAQHISKSLLLGHEAAGEVSANYSHWSLLVPLVLSGSTPNQHPASFKMTLRGNLLGLKGPAGKTVLNLTIHFLTERELNASHAGDGSSSGSTCLSFMAPAHVVPHTRCWGNNLQLNTSKTKELVVDFQHNRELLRPVTIQGEEVEVVQGCTILGVHLNSRLD
ncbi:transmembrane protein 248 isoform X2 [Paramormyrops kingsleyae]|uniref:transmembrane protein 248 isoform X2 n=1 Tax=Paramormyrops kingsleyae TaxID=1676925 RepID=UPI003B972707